MQSAASSAVAPDTARSSAQLSRQRGETRQRAVSRKPGAAVGTRLVRLDGKKKVDGSEIFGADETPPAALGVARDSMSA